MHIKGISYALPELIDLNAEIAKHHPEWRMEEVEERIGVKSRYRAQATETAVDLAQKACLKLFKKHPDLPGKVDALIFCTQTPDYLIPSNASVLHGRLELQEGLMAFDINLACSGYVYGLGIASGLLKAGLATNILLVNADTYSKLISDDDRATRPLFGDAGAVTWLCVDEEEQSPKCLDFLFSSSGKDFDAFIVPAGGHRQPKNQETLRIEEDKNGNKKTAEQIHMNGQKILSFTKTKVVDQIIKLCNQNDINLEDVDWFFLHQASKPAMDSIRRMLQVPSEKIFVNNQLIGNTVSSSIPIALCEAIDGGLIQSESTLLLSGFGAGLSWASTLVQTGAY